MPKILRLITPTFNQGDYIRETIDSVLKQSIYDDIDYIVVNDGSYDGTKKLLEDYGDELKIINQNNLGQSATLNKYWSVGEGSKYSSYLSSDDVVYPNCYEVLISYLEKNPNVVAVYPDTNLIDSHGKIIGNARNGRFDIKITVENLICQPGVATIFRTEILSKVSGWDESLKFTPDLKFWIEISNYGEIVCINELLAAYRIHSSSTSIGACSTYFSDEIIRMVYSLDHYALDCKINVKNMISRAYIEAGISHYKNKRLFAGTIRIFKGIHYNINNIYKINNIKRVIYALIKGLIYND